MAPARACSIAATACGGIAAVAWADSGEAFGGGTGVAAEWLLHPVAAAIDSPPTNRDRPRPNFIA